MSLTTLLALGFGSYLLRATGLLLVSVGTVPRWAKEPLRLLAPAVLAGLVVTGLLEADGSVELDARWLGVALGVAVLWWRRSLILAMVVAAAVTGLARAAGVA